jgi:hypothetical protein
MALAMFPEPMMLILLMTCPVLVDDQKVDSSTYARFLVSQPIEEAWRRMEPNWLSPRDDRAWRAFMHAHHSSACT